VMHKWVCIPLAGLAFFCASLANAQSAFDLNIGFGSAHDSASGAGIDNANSLNAFGACTPGSGDPYCQATPSLSSFFLGFGGDVMLNKHFGAGAEFNITPARDNYGPLQYRQLFYDFNGIYSPLSTKRVALQLQGGIGGARTSFAISQSGCVGTAVCSTAVEPIGNASHFQIHAGIGVQIYLTEHIFIRPQFDIHYAPGLTDQFGSDAVPGGTIWIGYSFGEH